MESDVQLAIMEKARRIYGEETTFLTFLSRHTSTTQTILTLIPTLTMKKRQKKVSSLKKRCQVLPFA